MSKFKQSDIITLGGIQYRVRKENDDEAVLTRPYGNIMYVAPKRDGKFVGLPITKGYVYAE